MILEEMLILLKLKMERFCDNMYLHIGKNYIINEEKVIGIFNLENINASKDDENII